MPRAIETGKRRSTMGKALRDLPIRWQLILLLLALAVPFLAYIAIDARRQVAHQRDEAGQQMLAMARVLAARLDDHVGDIVQVLSLVKAIAGTGPDDASSNQALMTRIAGSLPAHTNSISVWGASGSNLGSLDGDLRGADVSGQAFFQDAKARPGLVAEAPVRQGSSGMVGIFAMRIERDGKVVGVVSITNQLRELQLLPAENQATTGRVVTVTNRSGIVLARSVDPEHWIGRDISAGTGGMAEARSPSDGVRDGQSADGIERIAGFATAKRIPWLVYVGLPVDAALAGVSGNLRKNLSMAGLLILLALMLFAWMARRMSRPLRQLEFDAQVFARGEWDHRSSAGGVAEINLLSSTLNQMAGTLKQREEIISGLIQEQQDTLNTELLAIFKVKDRCFSWVNAGGAKLLGYGPDELLGRSTRCVYPDDESYQCIGSDGYAALSASRSFRTQLQFVRKDGGRLWFDMQAMNLLRSPGEIIIMLVDITAMKSAEKDREQSILLSSQNAALRESDRVKSAFLSNMSHELHTPLNAVIGYSQILRRGLVPTGSPKYLNYLDDIGHSGQELLRLIDTMLDFAKAESNKIDVRLEPIDLGVLIDDAVTHIGKIQDDKAIELSVVIDPPTKFVLADVSSLRQVIVQVLFNAIRFSHANGLVAVKVVLEAGEWLRIDVEDHGIGIAETDIPRIFVAFQQLSEGNTKRFSGTGLGLSLAKKLIEAMGGSIRVVSVLGSGSTFSIILPMARAST